MFGWLRRKDHYEDDAVFDRAMRRARREYAARRPPPNKPSQRARMPWFGWLISTIMVAGALLAAFRTFPVFQAIAALTVGDIPATIEGFLAMITIDLAVIMFRFIIVYQKYRRNPDDAKLTRQVGIGALVAVGTQFFAQLYATRDISSEMAQWEGLEIVVAFSAAIGAMALAFIAAEIVAVLWVQSIEEHNRAVDAYTKEYARWAKGFGRSWARIKRDNPSLSLSHGDGGDKRALPAPSQRDKQGPSPSESKVVAYIRDNPMALDMSVRELAEAVGVSKSVAGRARNFIVSPSPNGHEKL